MENVVREPIELTAAELNAVAGGVAIAENLSDIFEAQAVGNASRGGRSFGATGLQLAIVEQSATQSTDRITQQIACNKRRDSNPVLGSCSLPATSGREQLSKPCDRLALRRLD